MRWMAKQSFYRSEKINYALFYLDKKDNNDTTELILKVVVEVAQYLLKELCDPKKATLDYITNKDGVFSWGNTTDKEHLACLGKMATNDLDKVPFAALTHQM